MSCKSAKRNLPITCRLSLWRTTQFTFSILSCIWFCYGCGKENLQTKREAECKWVSIGVVNDYDIQVRQPIFDFFVSNHVACYPEGYPACKIMIPSQDVERVHAMLRTNHPPGGNFKSVWDNP